MLDCRPALIGAVMLGLLLATFLHAAEHRVTLRGKLYASEEQISNGLFFTVGDDDSESITLQVTPDGPLAGYLAGTVAHRIIITLEPQP